MTNYNGSMNLDHCNTVNDLTYQVLSWLMVGVFVFGLPLNISVLYIFLFR